MTGYQAQLRADFPAYREPANPQPLTISATQKRLRPGEGLLRYSFDEERSFAWLISRNELYQGPLVLKCKSLHSTLQTVSDPSLHSMVRHWHFRQVCQG